MKKIFLFSLIFIFLSVQITCAEGFGLSVENKSAKASETVTVDLKFSNNSGIIAAIFELEYDKSCLELIKAEDKGLLKGAVFSQTYDKYPYIMLWNSSSAKNFTDDGTLASLTFKVLDNPEKDTAFIRLSYNPENVYDADLNNVNINIKNGAISITDIPPKKEDTSSGNKGHSSGSSVQKEPVKPVPEKKQMFRDVRLSDWYADAVSYVIEKGLMKGTSDTLFSPDSPLTRGMLVTVLYRNENSPAVNKGNVFEDVKDDMYYADAVSWAKDNKIISGVTETLFSPDTNITREQIVLIMHRYAKYKNYDVSVGENTNILSYEDFQSISEYAIEAMQYALGSSLIKGKTESTIDPLGNATRAEIATILQRFLETNR